MEVLLGGALAIIIIGSLALMVVPLFRGSTHSVASDGKWHYQCQGCKEEWEVDSGEITDRLFALSKEGVRLQGGGDPEFYYPDCPLCGAKASSIRMVKCLNPDCGKYFVTDEMKSPSPGGFIAEKRTPQVCPYCGTDRLEVIMEQARKARAERGR